MKALIAIAITFTSAMAFAHGGGTDDYGCHIDRSTGVRHCH